MNEDFSSTELLLKEFRGEVLGGSKSIPKKLQEKYFYDEEGDALFQQIMASSEYISRCELEIFLLMAVHWCPACKLSN